MEINGADVAVRCWLHISIAHYFLSNFPAHYKRLNITASSIEWVAANAHPTIVHHLDSWVLLQSGRSFFRLSHIAFPDLVRYS